MYIAPIIGCIVQVLMIEFVLQPIKHFQLHDIKIFKIWEMLKFSVPLCIATISYWLLSGYTKIVILQQLGTYANGLYAVANKFASMITLVITVFQYAWNEMAYLMAKDDNRVAKYEKSVEYIFKVVTLGSGVFMIGIKIIFPYIIDFTYNDALMLVPLSLIGVAANAFAGFIGTIFMAEKRTSWIFWTTIIGASINIMALWIFTPIWGLQGAIGALCLAFTALAIVRIYALRKMFHIKLPWSNFRYVFILVVVVYMFYMVNNILLLIMAGILLSGILFYSFRGVLTPLWISIRKKRG